MGDNVLESQAKNTKKRRARKAADDQQARLFERPEQVVDEFTVDCTDSSRIKVGDTLHCYPGRGDALVDVVYENQKVGIVNDGGGTVLCREIDEAGCRAVVVRDICQLSGTIKIQLKQD